MCIKNEASICECFKVPDDRKKWKTFISKIERENLLFMECFSSRRRNEGLLQDYFKHVALVKEEGVDCSIYVYCFTHCCHCSDLKWTHWKELFLEGNTDGECDITRLRPQRRCTTVHHHSHSSILPYYKDNLQLKCLLQEQDDEISKAVLRNLDIAKAQNEKNGMFAYKEDFDEPCSSWDENTWTKRLAGCMRNFVIQNHSHEVRYTATMGTKIFHDTDNVAFYRFHGSPDLVISQKKSGEEHSTMMIETIMGLTSNKSLSDSEDSQQTDTSTLENSVRDETIAVYKDTTVLQKTGELLGNMHTILVKKMLKRLFHNVQEDQLSLLGMLLSRPSGAVACKYTVQIIYITEHTDFSSSEHMARLEMEPIVGSLLPDEVCSSLSFLVSNK